MGLRLRSAAPGTLFCIGATVLLALASFNTPLIKSQYFLTASYVSGDYEGSIKIGTLGYCLTFEGIQTCVGPKVGYKFESEELFGLTLFTIPEEITRYSYLTYVLVLNIAAFALAGASTLFGLASLIVPLSVLCFASCLASLASFVSLLAVIFDLVAFYICKSRIDAVSGASASIGISAWLVLAAWILAGFGACAFGTGGCCIGSRNKRARSDPRLMDDYYSGNADYGRSDMRLQGTRDEQLYGKEQVGHIV